MATAFKYLNIKVLFSDLKNQSNVGVEGRGHGEANIEFLVIKRLPCGLEIVA